MPNAVDRIEKLLGDAEAAGGLSRRDVALNVARDLGLHPHDPEPNPPISAADKEDAKRAGMSDMEWVALTEAQRDQHRHDAATSAGFASGTVPDRLPASTSARVMSGGTSTPTNMVSSGGTARTTSATVSSGGSTKAKEA